MKTTEKNILLLFAAILFALTVKCHYSRSGENSSLAAMEKDGEREQLSLTELREDLREKRRVNVNTATALDLQIIPGVGEKTAAKIIGYRDSHGPFLSEEELMNIKGIGPKKLEKMREYIRVED